MRNVAQHILANHPGHMAMEYAGASGLISVVCAVLGVMWLIAAALIIAFRIGERRNEKTVHFVSDIVEHSVLVSGARDVAGASRAAASIARA